MVSKKYNGKEFKRTTILRTIPTQIGTYSKAKKGGETSRLSPLFTEEMMGFPFLWTVLPFLSLNGEPNQSKPTEMP